MAIYDDNWKSYCMYVLACGESSDLNWSAIEKYYQQGIGLLQWTNSRSYDLLRLFWLDNPNLFTVPSLKTAMENNARWGFKKFTGDEFNNVLKILESPKSKQIQKTHFNNDITNDIANVLKSFNFENTKLGGQLAMMSENLYWVSGDVSAIRRCFDQCAGINGTSLEQLTATMNSMSKFGKATHGDRHDKIYTAIKAWDGVSGKEDFGMVTSGKQLPLDDDNRTGVDTISNTTSDNDSSVKKSDVGMSIVISKMQKRGNVFHIFGVNELGTKVNVQMFQDGVNIWTPNKQKVQGGNDSGGTKYNPPTVDNPNPKPANPVKPTGKTGKGYLDLANSYVGKIDYVWGDGSGDRFSLDDGVADCSSFVMSVYYKYTGQKLVNANGVICQSTHTMTNVGTVIAKGSNGSTGIRANLSKMKDGDLLVVYNNGHSSAHVMIFGYGDRIVHCASSARDTVNDPIENYLNGNTRPNFTINRLFDS